jgi:hypothetical protein
MSKTFSEDFDRAFTILCNLEGYISDIKEDRGGKTIWGIAERYYPEEVKKMSAMTPEQSKEYAKNFYFTNFWNFYRCSSLPRPYSIIFFCILVNSPKAALKAKNETDNWRDFLFKIQLYYSSLVDKDRSQSVFFRGWINRTHNLWNKFYKEA